MMVYTPAGPALLTVIAPVVVLPVNVPVKPGGVAAVTLAMEPLSAGGAVGVTVVDCPTATLALG